MFNVYSGCYGYFNYPDPVDPWINIPIPSNKRIDNGVEVTPSIAENNRHSTPLNSIQTPVTVQPNLPDSLLIGVGLRDQNKFTEAKSSSCHT